MLLLSDGVVSNLPKGMFLAILSLSATYNLGLKVDLTYTSLDCGWKSKNLERTHKDTRTT